MNIPTEKDRIKFLIECNKKMDGIYIEETTEVDRVTNIQSHTIKFEASLSTAYAQGGYWSPSDAFYDVVKVAAEKHLGIKFEDFHFNNTHTIFYFIPK